MKALASSAKPVALTSLKEKGLAPLTNTNHDDEVQDDEVEKLAQWSVRALGDSPSPSSIYFPTSTSPHASSSSSSSSSPSSSLSLSSSSESTGPSSSSSSFSLHAQAQQPSQHMFIQPARTMETLPSHSPIAVPKQFMLKSLERLKRVRSDEVVSLLGITFAYLDNDKDGFILKDEAWNHFSSICGQARGKLRPASLFPTASWDVHTYRRFMRVAFLSIIYYYAHFCSHNATSCRRGTSVARRGERKNEGENGF